MRQPEEEWTYRSLSVMQDFYSKRAVAHASLFVASVFGLFTVLRLIYDLKDYSYTLTALSIVYIGLWIFGGYSFLNFSFYASIAHVAQKKIHRFAAMLRDDENKDDMEDEILKGEMKRFDENHKLRRLVFRRFFAFKTGHLGGQKWPRRNLDIFLVFAYFIGGLVAWIAVLLRI